MAEGVAQLVLKHILRPLIQTLVRLKRSDAELGTLEPVSLPLPARGGRLEGILGLLQLALGVRPLGEGQPCLTPFAQEACLILVLMRGAEEREGGREGKTEGGEGGREGKEGGRIESLLH